MTEIVKNDQEKKENFALYLLFKEAVAFDKDIIRERIKSVAIDEAEITPIVGLDGAV